jgi:hypothetical protein
MDQNHSRTLVVPALLLAAGAALTLAACQSQVVDPSLEQACTDFAQAYRTWEHTCLHVAAEPDEAALVARDAQACALTYGAPGSQVGASYWQDCTWQVTTDTTCGSYKCPDFAAGTLGIGAPCLAGVQCASLFCGGTNVVGTGGKALAGTVQCGTCQAPLPAGAPCNGITDACEVGLSCFSGSCRVQGAGGDPCVVWADCAFPNVCLSTGTCGSVLPDGAACGNSGDCASKTGCDVTAKICMPVHYGQGGQPCDGHVNRCESGLCDTATGICPTVLTTGAACKPTDPTQTCGVDERCFEGTCQIPDPSTCK